MMLCCIFVNFIWKKRKFIVLQHYQLCQTVCITYLMGTYIVYQSLTAKGYELVSGGTDNHLVLVNLKNKVR